MRSTLYGGDLEISILAQLFKMKALVYSSIYWQSGQGTFSPETHGLPADEEGGVIRLLFEEGSSGGQDHYSLLFRSRPSQDEFRLSSSSDEAPSAIPKASSFPYPQAAARERVRARANADSDFGSSQHTDALPPLLSLPPASTMFQLSRLPCYRQWFNAMASLQKLNWPHDIRRGETGTDAGRGIFVDVWVDPGDAVARYWGHLVDETGILQIECPATTEFFKNCSDARRPWSLAHGVSVNRKRSNLIVDGSHHLGSAYDQCERRFVCLCL